MKTRVWQVSQGDHRAALKVLFARNPNRGAERCEWGQPEYIFVTSRANDSTLADVREWLEETGIPHWIEPAGAFTFFEFKSDLHAVAFKLRWV